jgi:ectoine hydroxylase-related dioxygenase (phytanoyl-CoA dioxygenase family)
LNAIHPAIAFRPASASIVEQLRREGYVILRDAIDPALIRAIDAESRPIFERTQWSKGSFYGERTKRFLALLNHIPAVQELVLHPLVLDIANQMLGECDSIQLNSTQAIEVHPGARQQPPHRDQIIWHEGANDFDFVLSVSWPFVRYDAEVGATRVWPRSHHYDGGAYGEPVDIEMEPGDVMLFSGRVMHGQGCNSSDRIRRGIILSYSLGWLKPFENMMLTYPPERAREFPPELAELVGYRMQRPNLGSVEGKCPSALLHDDVLPLGLEDTFTPELARRVEEFHASLSHQEA